LLWSSHKHNELENYAVTVLEMEEWGKFDTVQRCVLTDLAYIVENTE